MSGDELRRLRELLGIPLADLAHYTGYSASFYLDLEAGRLPILPDVESRLLCAFGRHLLAQLRRGDHERHGA